MTVAELGQRMSSRELSEWMAYYQLEPFGEEIADYRHGVATASFVNLFAKKKVKPQDFMVMPQPEEMPPDSVESLRDKFKQNPFFGGRSKG